MSQDGYSRRNESFHASRRHQALLFLKSISKPCATNNGFGANGVEANEELEDTGADDDGFICGSRSSLKLVQSCSPSHVHHHSIKSSNIIRCKSRLSDVFSSPVPRKLSTSSSTISPNSFSLELNNPEDQKNLQISVLRTLVNSSKVHRIESRVMEEKSTLSISSVIHSTTSNSLPELYGYHGCFCSSRIIPCIHDSLRECTAERYRQLYPLLLSFYTEKNERIVHKTQSSLFSTLFPMEKNKKNLDKKFHTKFPRIDIGPEELFKAYTLFENTIKAYKLPKKLKIYAVLNYERLAHTHFINKTNFKSSAAAILLLLAKFYMDMKPENIEQFITHLSSNFGISSQIIFSVELRVLFNLQFQLSLPPNVVDELPEGYCVSRNGGGGKHSFNLMNGKINLFSY